MMKLDQKQQILIIDRHDYWRNIAAEILQKAGFSVNVLDTYDFNYIKTLFQKNHPNLVIFGCANIGSQEQEFINKMLNDHYQILILGASPVPWEKMRKLLKEGVGDVTDKPYDSISLIVIVRESLTNIESLQNYKM